MGFSHGGIHPTQYQSVPVHPYRDVIRKGQPSHASAPGQVGPPRSHLERDKNGDPERKPKKRQSLAAHDQHLDLAKEEEIDKVATISKVVSKLKGGYNPTGRQHKLVKTTPGSAGTNQSNPMTKQASYGLVHAAIHLIRNSKN